jgi:hypothetical protein
MIGKPARFVVHDGRRVVAICSPEAGRETSRSITSSLTPDERDFQSVFFYEARRKVALLLRGP